eukprot:scaffold60617_cov62-Phaeocystis_antarctica.AAC.2
MLVAVAVVVAAAAVTMRVARLVARVVARLVAVAVGAGRRGRGLGRCGPPPHLAILLPAPVRAPAARGHADRHRLPVARRRPVLHPPQQPDDRRERCEKQSKLLRELRRSPDRAGGDGEECRPPEATRDAAHRLLGGRDP